MPPATPAQPVTAGASGRWSHPALLAACLVGAVVLAYWNTLQSPFLFDDLGAVQNNPAIRSLRTALTPVTDGSTTTGRPVVNLSLALNYAVSGDAVWSYHAVNMLIHAAAALALFGLVRRTLAGPVLGPRLRDLAGPLAFWSALVWAVHPLQTESVTCVAQRTESLCGLFYLATLYAFVRAGTANGGSRWLVLSVLACLAGMATKEVMVTAPLIVLLFDRTFLAGSFTAAWNRRRGYYAALAATWLLLGALVLGAGGSRGVAAGFGLGISWWAYLLKQCEALVLYLKLSVWPYPLVLDYGSAVVNSWTEVWWQGLVILALLGTTVWALVRRPVAGFLGGCFFIILAPSSSVVPLVTQTMAEHRMYLPLAALAVGFVVLVHGWLGRRAAVLLAVLSVGLTVLTIARNHDYRTGLAIWTDTVARRPDSARAHINLGVELEHTDRLRDALEHYTRAIALDPGSAASGHYHAGAVQLALGDPAPAVEHLATAVRLAPGHVDARFALANALVAAGRPEEALTHYEQVLLAKPAADAHCNLGIALAALGRNEDASRHFAAALELQPDLAAAHNQLAKAFAQAGRTDEAGRHYAEAVRLAPDVAEAQGDYGLFLAKASRVDEALPHFEAAVRLRPGSADYHANLGNALLLLGKAREAIAQYEEALRLKPGDERARQNLS